MKVVADNQRNSINPQKFALWAAMASITMMFGAFMSAYIVKQASGNWLEFSLPFTFYLSTLFIVASSGTIHLSAKALVNGIESKYKLFLILSLILGLAFVVFQYISWTDLFSKGVDLKGNVSGSFLYLITGIHSLHVLGGIGAIVISLINAFALKFSNTQKRINRFDLVVNYWHFVDALWIILFLFLLFYK